MKKAMIETAVSRGIKEMRDDPERSIRRLCDLGKQFSKNRFSDMIFSVMQELLDNDDSSYYDMMHNLMKNTDDEAMKKFGVNFGYMSWTYGAGILRKKQEELGICLPWAMWLRIDTSKENGWTVEKLEHLIEGGQQMGIYVYFFRETGTSTDSYEMLDLLEKYKDCAFVWFRSTGRLTAAQIQMLKVCKNTVVALPVEDPETLLTAGLLRDQKIIFALSKRYGDSFCRAENEITMESVLSSETALFFLLAEDEASSEIKARCAQLCKDSRMEQKYPCLMIDYYGDAMSISKVLVEHGNIFELSEDGHVLLPDHSKGAAFPFDISFEDAMKSLMPPFPVTEQK